ncbi:hypothetical protein [Streptomyces sp. SCL15-6]|uniref:hypothetical protein n=1 Tax=Streptomyces sp. SCL15-6 TaxID=2967222 RepID=UPI002966C7B7|nr:hypothetical protein [Streptomyces sp. SCL15-6]
MTIDQPPAGAVGPAALQLPPQKPPVIRNVTGCGALGAAAGIEANFDLFGSLGGTLDQMIGSSVGQLVDAVPSFFGWF